MSRQLLVPGLLVLAALLVAAVLASLMFGSKPIESSVVLDALLRPEPGVTDHVIVRTVRVPRTVIAIMVGVGLGLAGALMQGLTRNPLADPGILGVEAGASLSVVLGIYFVGASHVVGYVWFAFLGAAVVSAGVYVLGATGRDGGSPVKLALAGAAVSLFLSSVTAAILIRNIDTLTGFRQWAVGSLSGRDLDTAMVVGPFIALGVVLTLSLGRHMNALALGNELAAALGQRPWRARLQCGIAVVLLCGAATAAAGPIGFIGLIVPHLARVATGPDNRWVLAYSALLGPIVLIAADVLGRVVDRPQEIQVGIMTALIGAPFFIIVASRRRMAEL
ncbi:MAG: iron ABC transporter permease [Aeromicrobium sp.]|uniref:FecCD family ABC transporter permease n=1 Tax=Aeromicrobium sp. TaxID=1871063 RepID=UPI0039E37B0A